MLRSCLQKGKELLRGSLSCSQVAPCLGCPSTARRLSHEASPKTSQVQGSTGLASEVLCSRLAPAGDRVFSGLSKPCKAFL